MGLNLSIKEKLFGRKLILKDLNYSFNDCGIYIISGKSGVGKTTLLRIIAGLDKDFSGNIDGVTEGKFSMHFQEYRLFDTLTALENVYNLAYQNPGENEIAEAKNLLLRLGLSEEDIFLLPKELSGGMKMRVSLARAFLKSADILLLDEPTKELDLETKNRVIDMINNESNSKLVILVTHENDISQFKNPTLIKL